MKSRRGSGLFHELVNSCAEVINGGLIAGGHRIHHTVAHVILQDHLSCIIQCGAHCRKLNQHLGTVLPAFYHSFDFLQVPDSPGEAVEYRFLIFMNMTVGMGNSVGMHIGVVANFLAMVMGVLRNRFMGMLRHGKRPLSLIIDPGSVPNIYFLNYYTSHQ